MKPYRYCLNYMPLSLAYIYTATRRDSSPNGVSIALPLRGVYEELPSSQYFCSI